MHEIIAAVGVVDLLRKKKSIAVAVVEILVISHDLEHEAVFNYI